MRVDNKLLITGSIAVIAVIMIGIFVIVGNHTLNSSPRLTGASVFKGKLKQVKVGYIPSISASPMFVALNRGYFKEEGIELVLTPFRKSKYAVEALARGDIDIIADAPISVLTLNAFERGVPIHIVAGMSQALPWLCIRKDLWDSGEIREIKDLKGRRVHSPSKGGGSYFGLAYVLKQEGLDIEEDLKLVFLGQKEAVAALESKSIDAASLRPPHLTLALERGLIVLYPNMSKYFPEGGFQRAVVFASGKFMKEQPETLRNFLRALLKGIKIYSYAYQGIEPYKTEVVEVISNLTGVDKEIVSRMEWLYIPEDGRPNIESIRKIHDFYLETGAIETPIDLNEFINLSFLPS